MRLCGGIWRTQLECHAPSQHVTACLPWAREQHAACRPSRDHGQRLDRQKSRLMWLVEDWGVDKFRDTIAEYMGDTLAEGKHMNVSLSSRCVGCAH